jgi:hypothetical protein
LTPHGLPKLSSRGRESMFDLLYIALFAVLFVLSIAMIRFFDRM